MLMDLIASVAIIGLLVYSYCIVKTIQRAQFSMNITTAVEATPAEGKKVSINKKK